MKQVIRFLLRKAWLEVRRSGNPIRASMLHGLNWLSTQKIQPTTVVDVGASNGCWSELCMRSFPDANYILFEPQPVHSEALDSFSESYPSSTIVKKAVGASEGETFFDAADPFGGALADTKKDDHTIRVDLTTIDNTLAELDAAGPYLIKLDTHGFERSILEGASNTLTQSNILIIEAYNYRVTDEALLFWELCEYLFQKGFRVIDLVDVMHRKHDTSLWQMDLIFIRSDWNGFNHNNYL